MPAPQAAALGSALGWSDKTAEADRFLVGAATLSLLAAAAERVPVLVLVDDLQWLDRESASALAFAARRLGPDAVGVVMATRTGAGPSDLVQDFPTLRVGGLSVAEAAPLLPEGVAGPVRERLVAETGGNPLALLEVSRGLDRAQMVGRRRSRPRWRPVTASAASTAPRWRGSPATRGGRCWGWR